MCKRILYVEDNPRNMLLVQRILEADGHALLQAWDGETGWETAVAHLPDLILMDLRLPGDVSGFELTRRLKANPATAHIPIVVLTAYGSGEAERLAADAGADSFLCKPADIRQIRATLHQFFAPETAVQPVVGAYHYAFI
ncbi:MAG: response regulator [Anaerolinea sp.]|nr:response regulator [Anaerolinea sp.]